MTSEQLTEIAGEPDSVRDEFFNKVWYYETHLVTVENDTVRQIASKAEIKAEIMRMQQEYNKIKGFE
jgi:outer membrane protein assembly factor BamE (lipoprotein component of BamABCDE complex)